MDLRTSSGAPFNRDEKPRSISRWSKVVNSENISSNFVLHKILAEHNSPLHLAMLFGPAGFRELDDVFIVLPDATLMTRFSGFTETLEENIPHDVRMLVGARPEFDKRFPQVAVKLHRDAAA